MFKLIDQLCQKTVCTVIFLLSTYKVEKMHLFRIVHTNDLFLNVPTTFQTRAWRSGGLP